MVLVSIGNTYYFTGALERAFLRLLILSKRPIKTSQMSIVLLKNVVLCGIIMQEYVTNKEKNR